ncbi:MAG: hypothetical protein ACLFQV_07395 [Vulcanimicrobiota bacterium]
MKKSLIIVFLLGFLMFSITSGWCQDETMIEMTLAKFYNDVQLGNVNQMYMLFTPEVAEKVKKGASVPDILGDVSSVFGWAEAVKRDNAKVFISGVNYNIQKMTADTAMVKTMFDSIIVRDGKLFNNDGTHKINMVKMDGMWLIQDVSDDMKEKR